MHTVLAARVISQCAQVGLNLRSIAPLSVPWRRTTKAVTGGQSSEPTAPDTASHTEQRRLWLRHQEYYTKKLHRRACHAFPVVATVRQVSSIKNPPIRPWRSWAMHLLREIRAYPLYAGIGRRFHANDGI